MENSINCIINAQKKDTYATIDTDSEDEDTYLKLNLWFESMKDKYITINDIKNMYYGETKKILCIDRNFYDLIKETKEPESPDKFFSENYKIEYTHENNLHGQVVWLGDWSDNKKEEFNFHIEYSENCWYPLDNNGKLQISDLQSFSKFTDNTIIHDSKDYPLHTRIGWRGPMILWDDVINSDKIYYE